MTSPDSFQVLILSGLLAGLVGLPWPVEAQDASVMPESLNYEPPNRGAPDSTDDAGSRPGCPESDLSFTALVPRTTNWGETLSDRPSFWFYVPNGASRIEVVIRDGSDRIIGRTTADIAESDGLLRVDWAGEPLAINQFYQWQAFFLCDPEVSESYLSAGGGILRRDDVEPMGDELPSRERLVWFAEQGLWFDLLNELMDLRLQDEQNPVWQQDWRSLLSDPVVGLDAWIDQDILMPTSMGNEP